MIGIYMITNIINRKTYIGQSTRIKQRFNEHMCVRDKACNEELRDDLVVYGRDVFVLEILERCSKDRLCERETYWIAKLKPTYNKTKGGKGRSRKLTDSEKAHLSKMNKTYWESLPENKKQHIINYQLTGPKKGHSVSAETRNKLRKANLGKKHSAETIEKRTRSLKERYKHSPKSNDGSKKPVKIIETNHVFESVADCAKYFNVHPSNVSSVLNGRQNTVKGYHVEYVV